MNKISINSIIILSLLFAAGTLFNPLVLAQDTEISQEQMPVIDMHLHTFSMQFADFFNVDKSKIPYNSTQELINDTITELKKNNVVLALSSGINIDMMQAYKKAYPEVIKLSVMMADTSVMKNQFQVDWGSLSNQYRMGTFFAMGEAGPQYFGMTADDPEMDPIYSLAAELDIPIGIHVGLGNRGLETYSVEAGNPLYLEKVLEKYPGLRLYAMHAGYPFLEEMKAILWHYPNVYVDISNINYVLPEEEFYAYLHSLIRAGFGKRIMYGSDQMLWPERITESVNRIKDAEFLSPQEKRDILYNNAAHFLELTEEEINLHKNK